MAANGDPTWPPAGRTHGRQRGDPLTATGDEPVTVDNKLHVIRGSPRRPRLPLKGGRGAAFTRAGARRTSEEPAP